MDIVIPWTINISRTNITRHCAQYEWKKAKMLFRLWTHKWHSIPRPYGRDTWVSIASLKKEMTAIYWERAVYAHCLVVPCFLVAILSVINSLAPGRFEWHLKHIVFKVISVNNGWGISYNIALTWMSLYPTGDQSTLVQMMAWCHQGTSHYLNHCWPCPMTSYCRNALQKLCDLFTLMLKGLFHFHRLFYWQSYQLLKTHVINFSSYCGLLNWHWVLLIQQWLIGYQESTKKWLYTPNKQGDKPVSIS